MYVSLKNHSHYSFLNGVPSVKSLVEKAAESGMAALALTDINSGAGLILFLEECRKYNIKPLLGIDLQNPDNREDHLVIIARNFKGYKELCSITSHFLCRFIGGRLAELFRNSYEDILVFSSAPQTLEELCHSSAKPYLYGEICVQDDITRQKSKHVLQLAENWHLPVIATNNVFFIDKEDYELHRILRAIDLNTSLDRLSESDTAPSQAWFKTEKAMLKKFPDHAGFVHATEKIAALCTDDYEQSGWILPHVENPLGIPDSEYLEQLAMEGLLKNYGGKKEYVQARNLQIKELGLIRQKGYDSYFLMVRQIRHHINNLKSQGYRKATDCTLLRGSAANSITLYNIGASELDPIRYNLYFERFLNEERASPPDADIDFGWDERENAIQYMFDTWGEDRVAVLCTINHFRWRAALRETAKVFGCGSEELNQLILEMQREKPSVNRKDKVLKDDTMQKIFEIAAKIEGRPRHFSQHCGGVIVTNEPIWRYTVCQPSGGKGNRIITQLDMHSGIDFLGLIKFDLLGNGSLSVLRDTLQQIHEQQLPDPKVWNVDHCIEDKGVQEMLAGGLSRGIFYLESPAQMRLNQKAQAETFDEIGITSSLIRPAGTKYCDVFVERHREMKAGRKNWEFLHPSLASILGETHDVCVYQEDIIRICAEIAGFSFKEADQVRKMMNSQHEGEPENYRETADKFIRGCIQHHQYTEDEAKILWERISSFRGFSFCKSHSLSYARLSYQCAYLKQYYPAQFLASVISNQHGFYSYTVYIEEARRWGIEILKPGINSSEYHYRGYDSKICPGLMHLRNSRSDSLKKAISERSRGGFYLSLADFVKRNPQMNYQDIYSLIQCGAFDEIELNRRKNCILLSRIFADKKKFQEKNQTYALSLNSADEDLPADLKDFSFSVKCLHEQHILGYIVSGNYLNILARHPAALKAVPLNHLKDYTGRKIKVFGSAIAKRTHRISQRDSYMMFITLQDASGTADLVCWSRIFEKYHSLLQHTAEPMEYWGTVKTEQDTYILEVERIQTVNFDPAEIGLASENITGKGAQYTWKKAAG